MALLNLTSVTDKSRVWPQTLGLKRKCKISIPPCNIKRDTTCYIEAKLRGIQILSVRSLSKASKRVPYRVLTKVQWMRVTTHLIRWTLQQRKNFLEFLLTMVSSQDFDGSMPFKVMNNWWQREKPQSVKWMKKSAICWTVAKTKETPFPWHHYKR